MSSSPYRSFSPKHNAKIKRQERLESQADEILAADWHKRMKAKPQSRPVAVRPAGHPMTPEYWASVERYKTKRSEDCPF